MFKVVSIFALLGLACNAGLFLGVFMLTGIAMGLGLNSDIGVCVYVTIIGGIAGIVLGTFFMSFNDKRGKESYDVKKGSYFTKHKIKYKKVILSILLLLIVAIILTTAALCFFIKTRKISVYDYHEAENLFLLMIFLWSSAAYWLFFPLGGIISCFKSRCKQCQNAYNIIDIKGYVENYHKSEGYQTKQKTSSGSSKTGEVYDGNTKVGDVYQSYTNISNYKRKVTKTSYVQKCKCVYCGNSTKRNVSKTEVGNWEWTT